MSIKQKLASFNRDNTNRIKALPRGNKHWNWSDTPTLLTLHKRIVRKYGKAKWHNCIDCGKQAVDWSNSTGKYTVIYPIMILDVEVVI